jgi:membrane protease YdiL (CAAX protease family)
MLVYEASRRFSDKGFFHNVGLIKGNNGFLKLFFFPALSGLMLAVISVYIVFARDVSPATPLGEMIGETQSSYILLVFLLMAVGVAPLVEEVIFRGYFFHVLRELKGIVFTVPVISLSFAVLHVGQYWGDWTAILMITLIGFALTLFRLWAGSTMASCVMHYVYNGAVTLIPALMLWVSNPAYVQYHAGFDRLSLAQKEELLRQAIEKEPDLADAHYELANLYLQENRDIDGALKAINEAISYFPDDRVFLETKALALERLNRYGEALKIRQELLRKALSK